MPFDARKTAWIILNTLDHGQRTLTALMEEHADGQQTVSRRERALLQALVYGVLRWRGRLDYFIANFSRTRFNKIHPKILNILRLALFQIIYLDRIPDSAAVNTAVEMTKAAGAPWVIGYVNALLRKASREYRAVSFPELSKNPSAALAARKSFPEWIIHRWLQRYGQKNTALLCDAVNAIPPITVRTNTLRTSPQNLLVALECDAEKVAQTPYSPDGITIVNPATSIPNLNGFQSGWFQVQDEAAQLVSLMLDPKPGETILDACAGMGGKTGHIAQLMNNEGKLAAVDIDGDKLSQLEAEMRRLGISIVSTHCLDLEQGMSPLPGEGFDRILLDAPCSGLGVMRRNPDIKWHRSEKELVKHNARQLRLLENLATAVRPAGFLVYVVCSPEPEENEVVIRHFLKKHSNFDINNQYGQLPNEICKTAITKGFFKTFPCFTQMDGFFSVRLQRIS
ncbi:MAG: 16S rRNA (cytosine(967)-C(5))-methyltransferase RsmB [Desulfobacterales bacterium]|jgi:16S rRNA (cytosine967-C5)-methyltransferase